MQVDQGSIGIEGGPCHRTTLLSETVPWLASLPRTQNQIPLASSSLEEQTVYQYLRQGVSPVQFVADGSSIPTMQKGAANSMTSMQ
jgi:hypothetical protein